MSPVRRVPAPVVLALAAAFVAPGMASAAESDPVVPAPAAITAPAELPPVEAVEGEPTAIAPALKLVAKPALPFARGHATFATAATASSSTLSLATAGVDTLQLELARRVGKKTVAVRGSDALSVSGPLVHLGFGGQFAGRRLASGTYRLTITPLRGAVRGQAARVTIKLA